jgi:hypothetical protein
MMKLGQSFERFFGNRFVNRIAHKAAFALAMLLCIAWSAVHALRAPAAAPADQARTFFQEWPAQWDGAPLRPLALSEVEQRFARHFPGTIARLTDGHQTLVLRRVDAPTRMLHPASDCYRALGYRIRDERLVRQAGSEARLSRCFVADRAGGARLKVCEHIVGADGSAFTDSSAWYWAALAGRSAGPWQAVTLAQPLQE